MKQVTFKLKVKVSLIKRLMDIIFEKKITYSSKMRNRVIFPQFLTFSTTIVNFFYFE